MRDLAGYLPPSTLLCLAAAATALQRLSSSTAMLVFVRRSAGAGRRPAEATIARTLQAHDRLRLLFAWRKQNCLHRSATLATALRWQGVPAQLTLGVARDPFRAHAWVEVGGSPLGEPRDALEPFSVIARF